MNAIVSIIVYFQRKTNIKTNQFTNVHKSVKIEFVKLVYRLFYKTAHRIKNVMLVSN